MDDTPNYERPERPEPRERDQRATIPPRGGETSTSSAAAIEACSADRVTHIHHHHHYYQFPERRPPPPPRDRSPLSQQQQENATGTPRDLPPRYDDVISEDAATAAINRRRTDRQRRSSWRRSPSPRRRGGYSDWEPITILSPPRRRSTDRDDWLRRQVRRNESINKSVNARVPRARTLTRSNTITVDVSPQPPVRQHSRGRYSPIRRRSPRPSPVRSFSPSPNRIVTFQTRQPSPRPLPSQSSSSPSSSASSSSSTSSSASDPRHPENDTQNQQNDSSNDGIRISVYQDDIVIHDNTPPENAYANLAQDAIRHSRLLLRSSLYELIAHIKNENPEQTTEEAWASFSDALIATGSTAQQVNQTWLWAFRENPADHFETVYDQATATLIATARGVD